MDVEKEKKFELVEEDVRAAASMARDAIEQKDWDPDLYAAKFGSQARNIREAMATMFALSLGPCVVATLESVDEMRGEPRVSEPLRSAMGRFIRASTCLDEMSYGLALRVLRLEIADVFPNWVDKGASELTKSGREALARMYFENGLALSDEWEIMHDVIYGNESLDKLEVGGVLAQRIETVLSMEERKQIEEVSKVGKHGRARAGL